MKEILLDNQFLIINIGFGLVFLGLAIREVLWLRIVLTLGYVFRLLQSMADSTALSLNVSIWNTVFIMINIYMIIRIINERRDYFIPDEVKDIKNTVFKDLTSKEFLYLWNIGENQKTTKNVIINEGIYQNKLMFILDGSAIVERNERQIATLKRGQFIAEMSLLTNQPTSAKVSAENELNYIEWNTEILKNIERTNLKFWIKLQSVLSKDVTDKIKAMH